MVVENVPALLIWALTGRNRGTEQLESVGVEPASHGTVLLRGLYPN